MTEDFRPDSEPHAAFIKHNAEPDPHGQAALLLAESILHALVETGGLTSAQAIGVIRTASEVKVDVAEETDESTGRMRKSIGLLATIEQSLTAGDHRADTDGRIA